MIWSRRLRPMLKSYISFAKFKSNLIWVTINIKSLGQRLDRILSLLIKKRRKYGHKA